MKSASPVQSLLSAILSDPEQAWKVQRLLAEKANRARGTIGQIVETG